MIQMYGSVYIGDYSKPGWSGELPFYAFRCRKHGIVTDYVHDGKMKPAYLECPKCKKEAASK